MTKRTCSVEGCTGFPSSCGWCTKHWLRWKTHGSMDQPVWCIVEGCTRESQSRNWCAMHYHRWLKFGDVGPAGSSRSTNGGVCAVERCPNVATKRGWCGTHYTRWLHHGDPLFTKLIVRNNVARFESRVDRSGGPDACHPFSGKPDADGYCIFKIGTTTRKAHAVAWEMANGPVPRDQRTGRRLEMDHLCHGRALAAGTCVPGICEHRRCCNDRHLEPKTRLEHIQDTQRFIAMRFALPLPGA